MDAAGCSGVAVSWHKSHETLTKHRERGCKKLWTAVQQKRGPWRQEAVKRDGRKRL